MKIRRKAKDAEGELCITLSDGTRICKKVKCRFDDKKQQFVCEG